MAPTTATPREMAAHDSVQPPTLEPLLEHADWLSALARRLVSDPATADDLTQRTWLRALGLRGTAALRAPRAWLAQVLRNEARQVQRGEARRAQHEADAAARADAAASDAADPTVETAALVECQRNVADAVLGLDEPFRSTVLLHHFRGWTLARIAREQEVAQGTVRWRLHKAHALLRERLAARYGPDWRAALAPLTGFGVAGGGGAPVAVAGAALWLLVLVVAVVGLPYLLGLLDAPPSTPAGRGSGGAHAAPLAAAVVPDDRGAPGTTDARRTPAVATAGLGADDVDSASPTSQESSPGRGLESAVVTARLVDGAGEPLEGAELAVQSLLLGNVSIRSDERIQWLLPPGVAGADGRVSLTLRTDPTLLARLGSYAPAPGGTWRIRLKATADGCRARVRDVQLVDGQRLDLDEIVLTAGADLTGRVVDPETGNGLNGARVWVQLPPLGSRAATEGVGQPDPMPIGDGPRLRTRSFGIFTPGAFSIRGVPTGPVLVWVEAEGRAPRYHFFELAGGVTDLGDLRAGPRDGSVRVRVVRDGRPVAGARVLSQTEGLLFSRTGDDGTCTVPSGSRDVDARGSLVQLHAMSEGLHAFRQLRVGAETVDVTLDLAPLTRHATVEVRSAADDRPVVGATVRWVGWTSMQLQDAPRTDAAGTATVAVPPIEHELWVEADGFARGRVAAARTDAPNTVHLVPVRSIEGRVLDAAGEPVAEAEVVAVDPTASRWSARAYVGFSPVGRPTKTDADGRFTIDGAHLRTTATLQVMASAPGRAPGFGPRFSFSPDGAPVAEQVIRLSGKGATLRVRVVDAAGVPLAAGSHVVALGGPGCDGRRREVDDDGVAVFRRLAPGTYHAALSDPNDWSAYGAGSAEAPFGTFEIGADEVREHTLVARERFVSLDLTVDGRPAPDGWTAELCHGHVNTRLDRSWQPDERGLLTMGPVTNPGPYTVLVWSPGRPGIPGLRAEVPVALGADDASRLLGLELDLGRLEGEVPAALRSGRFTLVQARADGTRIEIRVRPDEETGRFVVPNAPVGSVELIRRPQGGDDEVVGRFAVEKPTASGR